MNNLVVSVLSLIVFWIIFSVVNGLTAANENCCRNKTCGQGIIDKAVWWINLTAAMIPTLYVAFYIGVAIASKGKSLTV